MENIKFRIYIRTGQACNLAGVIKKAFCSVSTEMDAFWIVVEQVACGRYVVVEDNLTVKSDDRLWDDLELGFIGWDDEVEDLDAGDSEESQCFGMSNRLRWNDVDLTPEEFRAPSIERLREALVHVTLCAWCPDDI